MTEREWILDCMYLCDMIYLKTPVEIFMKIYKLKPELATENNIEKILEIADGPYTCEDNYVFTTELEKDLIDNILKEEKAKRYYIPTEDEVLDICQNNYPSMHPAYSKMRVFLKNRTNESQLDMIMTRIWQTLTAEGDKNQLIYELAFHVALKNESELNMFSQLMNECSIGTMIPRYKGWSVESMEEEFMFGRSVTK
jgi:hypothetical protein